MIVDNNLQKNATFIEFYKYYLKHYALDNKNFNSANHVQPQSMKLEIVVKMIYAFYQPGK